MNPAGLTRCTRCGCAFLEPDEPAPVPVCTACGLEFLEYENRHALHAVAVELRPVSLPDPAAWPHRVRHR